jgi:hypothetical protein
MAGVTGREARMAFAKFTTNSWGVAASVTLGAYFADDGGMKYAPVRVNDEAFGQNFLGRGDLGDLNVQDLTFTGRDRYADHVYRWEALAMGSPSAVTISTSAVGQVTSWQHITNLAPSIDGLGLTLAIDKVLFVDELTSAKVYGFSKAVGDAGVMDSSFKVMGAATTNISSVNTRSTVNGASYPGFDNRVFRKNLVFRMNVQGGSTLAAGDEVKLETWGHEFERPQDAPHVTGQDYVLEPGDNGFPMVKVSVSYPRMSTVTANSLYNALRADTVFKADATFSGAYINSTDRYTEKYEYPALEFDSEGWSAPLAGATQVKPTATFIGKMAATSPSGMAFVNPFRLTRITTQSVVAF